MSDANIIAARYVSAFFELVAEKNQQDNVKKDLLALKAILQKGSEFQKFLENPVITRKQAEKAMETVLTAIKATELTKKFFSVLANQRRLALTPVIIDKYIAKLAESRGELVVQVVSASMLGKEQLDFLAGVLTKATKKNVELKLIQNPALLGGVQIHIGSKMLDNSVLGKLTRLRQTLLKAA